MTMVLYFQSDGGIRSCSNSPIELSSMCDEDPIGKAWESPLLQTRRAFKEAILEGNRKEIGEPCGVVKRLVNVVEDVVLQ